MQCLFLLWKYGVVKLDRYFFFPIFTSWEQILLILFHCLPNENTSAFPMHIRKVESSSFLINGTPCIFVPVEKTLCNNLQELVKRFVINCRCRKLQPGKAERDLEDVSQPVPFWAMQPVKFNKHYIITFHTFTAANFTMCLRYTCTDCIIKAKKKKRNL